MLCEQIPNLEVIKAFNSPLTLLQEEGKLEYDLLITDIEMPQMDGHTLTRRIKEHNILKNMPVIIFSSLITSELRHKGDSVGADEQLSKPEIDKLVTVIDTYLDK